MNVITWNIRGINTNDKISQLFTLVTSHKLTMLSLVENKLTTKSIERLKPRFP